MKSKYWIITGELFKKGKRLYFINVVNLRNGNIVEWKEFSNYGSWKQQQVYLRNKYRTAN